MVKFYKRVNQMARMGWNRPCVSFCVEGGEIKNIKNYYSSVLTNANYCGSLYVDYRSRVEGGYGSWR